MPQLVLGEMTIDVVMKKIKNIHLSVYPPDGSLVRVSAPQQLPLDTIRVFVISRLDWIKQQQKKLQAQARETPRDYTSRESHYYKGKRYLLEVVEQSKPAGVELVHNRMILSVPQETEKAKRETILKRWYRKQLRKELSPLIRKYEGIMGVSVREAGIKQMKTRWGTCNPQAGRIWLNLELIKKPPEYLEYIIVHEMAHLLEPSHNERYIALLDTYMPKWRFYKEELNRLPVKHEKWGMNK